MPRQRAATDLEAAVLGIVARDGPCTAYAIRQQFLRSRSEHWSGSAGAIYPLMRRLVARKLVEPRPGGNGRRTSLRYRIAPAGRAALRDWLLQPARVAAVGFDPLRVRLLFLDNVPATVRHSFYAEAAARLERAQRAAAERLEGCAERDPALHLALRSEVGELEARRRVLEEARRMDA